MLNLTHPHLDETLNLFGLFKGELAQAIRNRTNITFGLYFSLYEWYHPYYMEDAKNSHRTQKYVDVSVL